MVKRLLAVLLLSAPLLVYGQTAEDFSNTVDFALTLGDLNRVAASGDSGALPDRLVIVEAAVASREVVNGDAEAYLGELMLVSGEWIGVSEVVRYQCVLQLTGPEFAAAIPARRSRKANPAEIALNTRILTVASVVDVRQLADGTYIPVLLAHYIRRIQ
jgi:hypothetical protein